MNKETITTAPNRSSGRVHLLPLIGVYLALIVVATGITYYISVHIQKNLVDTVTTELEKEELINEQLHAIHTRHLLIRDIVMAEDPFDQDDLISLHAEYARTVLSARQDLTTLSSSEEEQQLIDIQWNDSRTAYTAQADIIEKKLALEGSSPIPLYRELLERTRDDFYRRMDEMESLRLELRNVSKQILEEAEANQLRSWFLVIIFYLLTLVGGAAAIIWIYIRQREHQKTLQWETTHDSLTALANRYMFEQQLQVALDQYNTSKTNYVLLYMDLDHFKLVNDSSGHTAGDTLLKQISVEIQNSVRSGDMVARLGGDEFGVLLQNCDATHAYNIANNIRAMVEKYTFEWDGRKFDLGVSVGLIPVSEEHNSVTDLLKSADIACYTAKDLGRNRVHIFQDEDQVSTSRLRELEYANRIRKALYENHFKLFSQRIVPITEGLEEHREILLRLIGDDQKIISPKDFLPIAEQYNLISSIDLWVLKNTCEYILNSTNLNTCFSVNLSGATLNDRERLDALISIINNCGVDPKLLVFEITETAAISSLSGAVNFMHEVKDLGCRFALDDFGSGLSSFTYLKQMPVDYLKIDGSFIHKLKPNTIDFTFVQSIQAIAKTMGIYTVAEWVEDQTVLDYLQVLGIDYAQGNHLDPASPLIPKYELS